MTSWQCESILKIRKELKLLLTKRSEIRNMVEARPTKKKVTNAATPVAATGRGAGRGRSRSTVAFGSCAARGPAATNTAASGRGAARGTAATTTAASGSGAGSRMIGAQRDDCECPVCLELCAQPVLTPCKHFMCFQCHKRVVEAGMTCPMCRAHFDKLFIPQIDVELQ